MEADLVILEAYSAEWPARFEREKRALAAIFPGARIEHVGSTAVPGLGAKPIVDILLGASSLAAVEARITVLEAAGYAYVREFEAQLPQRRYFVKPLPKPRHFHLHAVAIGDRFFDEQVAFRDALRASPALAEEYWRLKQGLAVLHREDRAAYTDAKAPFIQSVLRRVEPELS